MPEEDMDLVVEPIKSVHNAVESQYNPFNDDIFRWEEFPVPVGSPPIELLPGTLRDMLIEYSRTTTTITDICRFHNTSVISLLALTRTYPAVQEAYHFAKACKATVCNDRSTEYYQDRPPEWAYDTINHGESTERRLSSPAVSWIRDRASTLSKQAAILDRHTYGDVQRVESKSLALNLHSHIPAGSRELADAIDSILQDQVD